MGVSSMRPMGLGGSDHALVQAATPPHSTQGASHLQPEPSLQALATDVTQDLAKDVAISGLRVLQAPAWVGNQFLGVDNRFQRWVNAGIEQLSSAQSPHLQQARMAQQASMQRDEAWVQANLGNAWVTNNPISRMAAGAVSGTKHAVLYPRVTLSNAARSAAGTAVVLGSGVSAMHAAHGVAAHAAAAHAGTHAAASVIAPGHMAAMVAANGGKFWGLAISSFAIRASNAKVSIYKEFMQQPIESYMHLPYFQQVGNHMGNAQQAKQLYAGALSNAMAALTAGSAVGLARNIAHHDIETRIALDVAKAIATKVGINVGKGLVNADIKPTTDMTQGVALTEFNSADIPHHALFNVPDDWLVPVG